MRGLKPGRAAELYKQHIGHCQRAHGDGILMADCPVCVSFCDRVIAEAGITPEMIIASPSADQKSIEMAKAVRDGKHLESAWE